MTISAFAEKVCRGPYDTDHGIPSIGPGAVDRLAQRIHQPARKSSSIGVERIGMRLALGGCRLMMGAATRRCC